MRSYFFRTPKWLHWIYPDFIWEVDTPHPELFVTFDDGPDPVATPYVLDQLDHYSAKATFFCIGEKMQKHPELITAIRDHGHAIGNHTFSHINGWKSRSKEYMLDVRMFEEEAARQHIETSLFRPPYGRIKKRQARQLLKGHKVIMWSHLSGDFDDKLTRSSAEKALFTAKKGSILLFHDSFAAYENLKNLLPSFLARKSAEGYIFKSIFDAID